MFALPWNRPSQGSDDEPELITRDEARLPLHVLAGDAELSVENGMLLVQSAEDSRSVRLDELSIVALHGGARVSVPCLHLLARQNVPLILLSRSGFYLGQMTDLSTSHAAIRRAQYDVASDPRRSLKPARLLVSGKIANTARIARRRLGARAPLVRTLGRAAKTASRARSADRLRGIEGAAARSWYAAWPEFLADVDSLFAFDGRSRRPARDATNALLSYLYAVLAGTAATAACASGLDPNTGFFHAERPGRPALVLDLVEPFRVAVVDAAVIAAIHRREFSAEAFETQEDGSVRLSDTGRRRALDILERRLSTGFVFDGAEMTWRAAIGHMTGLLAAALRTGDLAFPVPLPRG